MRLKEDSNSWRSSSIKRRDFRHDYGTPEVPKGHPKRKQKQRKPKKHCKHVWVEVKYDEFVRYRGNGYVWWDREIDLYYIRYTTYYVCPGCADTKTKIDRAKQRRYYWKRRQNG